MALLTKKFPTIIGILVLVVGVFFGIWYVNSKQNSGSGEAQPINVRITNVADNKFTVSWTTDVATEGRVLYGKLGDKLTQIAIDERDLLGNESSSYITHFVTIKDLQPSTAYAFRIASGNDGVLYDNNGSPYSVITGPSIAATPPAETIYGQVEQTSTLPAEGAIVYISFPGAAAASALVKSSGSYTIPVSVLRTTDLKNYIKYDPEATIFSIVVEQGKQQASAEVSTANAAPVPLITMGSTYDFKSAQIPIEKKEPVVAQVEPQAPTAPTPTPSPNAPITPSIFNVEPLGSSSSSAEVKITNPSEEGEVIATKVPEFAGTGPKGTVLSLVLQSTKKTYKDTVAVDSSGKWAWAPASELLDGNYNVSLAYVGVDSKEKIVKRAFSIDSSLSQPAFVSTPSASLKPIVKPSMTATPSPSLRAAMPATDSGVPVTGVFENTMLTAVFAAVIMVGGVLLLAL